MRAETRPHPTHLWADRHVNQLPLSQKRMLDYAWTGPDVNGIGVTTVEPLVFQARVGELADSVENCLRFLSGFVLYDEDTQEIFVLDWFRFHKFSSPAGKNAALKGLKECRSEKIKEEVKRRARLAGWDVFDPKTAAPGNENHDSLKNQKPDPPTTTQQQQQRQQQHNSNHISPGLPPRGGRGSPPGQPLGELADNGFRKFWATYPPGRGDQGEALQVWRARCASLPDEQVALLMRGLAAWVGSEDWTKESGRYIPNPARFLREERWRAAPASSHFAVGSRESHEAEARFNGLTLREIKKIIAEEQATK